LLTLTGPWTCAVAVVATIREAAASAFASFMALVPTLLSGSIEADGESSPALSPRIS
jgi:hypothetical protein